MTDDLVKRLRDPSTSSEASTARHQAADRIDELEVSLQAVLNREAATTARYDAKTDELEAKLAKATEALRDMCAEFRGHDLPYGSKAYLKATTVLAEIEGGKG
jgi:hypothetical protein